MTLLLTAITLVALTAFHGAAAGIRASAGRDGRLDHRRAERKGAWRGISVALALVVPGAVVGAIDASGQKGSLDMYESAAFAFSVVAGPVVAIAAIAFGIALVAAWPVRAFVNTVVIGGLEFIRPAAAVAAVIAVWWATRDPSVTAAAALTTASAMLTYRVVSRLWYSTPATLPPVATSPEGFHAHR